MRLSTPSPSPATPHHSRPAKPKTHQNGRTLDCVKNDQKRSAARPPRENRLMTCLIWFIDLGVWANEGALWTVCYYLKTRCDLIGYRDNAAPRATVVTVSSGVGTSAQQQPQLPGAVKDNLFPPARARIQPGTQFGAKNLLLPSIGLGWGSVRLGAAWPCGLDLLLCITAGAQSPATAQKLFIPGPPPVFPGHRRLYFYYQRRLSKTATECVVLASPRVLYRRTKVGSLLVSCRQAAAAPLYCEDVMLGITSKTGISYPWHNTRLSLGHCNADFNTIYTCKSRKNGWRNQLQLWLREMFE